MGCMNSSCYRIAYSRRINALIALCDSSILVSDGTTHLRRHHRSRHKKSEQTPRVNAVLSAIILALPGLSLSMTVQAQSKVSPPAIATKALPTGEQVVAGQVGTNVNGSTLNLTQTSNAAIMNWASFNVGTAAKVNIAQPSNNSILLNRVVGGDPTQIHGQLQANGQVMLVNPNGIVVGRDGSVSASGFTASTFNITDANFLAKNFQFERQGSTAGVRVDGSIKTQSGGYVHLVGAEVTNNGSIVAPQGSVVLAAGEVVTVGHAFSVPLSQRVKVNLSASSINAAVTNTAEGVIVTEGGHVLLQASALSDAVASVTHRGLIDSRGPQGGSVTLLADRGVIQVDGLINASSTQLLSDQAVKGGDVVIGRDPQTGVLAKITNVSDATIVSDRGFVETSGHLLTTANVQIKAGLWSLDPNDVEINTTGTTTSLGTSVVKVGDIQSALDFGTSVTISTGVGTSGTGAVSTMNGSSSNQSLIGAGSTSEGNILVKDSITKSAGGTATLTLLANNNIVLEANTKITSSVGRLNVSLNSNLSGASGAIVMNSGSKIYSNGGNITMGGGVDGLSPSIGNDSILNGISLMSATLDASGGDITLNGRSNNQLNTSHQNGILLSGNSLIQTTGTGKIILRGVGKATGSSSYSHGIRIDNSMIAAGTTGAIEMSGTGSDSATGSSLSGVLISGTSVVSTLGAPIKITGETNNAGTPDSYGIDVIGGKILNLGNGAINLTTDSLSLVGANNVTPGSFSTIYAGSGKATIESLTSGTLIDIGGPDRRSASVTGILTLGLSDIEINQITAGTLQIGNELSGSLGVSTSMTTNAASGNIHLLTGGTLTVGKAFTSGKGLFLQTKGQQIVVSSILTGSNITLDTSLGEISHLDGSIHMGYESTGSSSILLTSKINASGNVNVYGASSTSPLAISLTGEITAGGSIRIEGNTLVTGGLAVKLSNTAKLTATTQGSLISIVSNESLLNDGLLSATANYGSGTSIKLIATNGTITGSGQIGLATHALSTVTMEQGGSSQYDGRIYAQYLNKSGVGGLTLRNEIIATNFNVNDGSVQLGDGTAATSAMPSTLSSSKINIGSGHSLIFNRLEDFSTQAVITGAGKLILVGPGILTLTGDSNGFAGTTQVEAGRSLWIGTGGSLGAVGSAFKLMGSESHLVFSEASGVSNVGSNISGIGAISQVGAGTGMLSGTNTYTGATTVLGGTLQLNNAEALGNTSSTTIGVSSASTASLDLNGLTISKDLTVYGLGNSPSIGAITNSNNSAAVLSGVVTLATDVNLGGNQGSIALTNQIVGANGVTKVGSNGLILDVSINGTTTTAINAGTLQIGNGGTKGSLGSAGSVSTQGTLAFKRSDNIALTTQITGSGGIAQLGTGTLTLLDSVSQFGVNNYLGTTAIRAGKLQVGNGGTAGNLGAGSIINNTMLEINRIDSVVLSQVMSGLGKFIQQGQGTTILAANNTNSGSTLVNAGVLQVGNNGSTGQLGAGDVLLSNQSILKYFLTSNAVMDNVIKGVGQVQANITGALTVKKQIGLTSGTVALIASGTVVSNASIQSVGGTLISGDQGVVLNSQVSNSGSGTVIIAAGQSLAAGDASGGQVVATSLASLSNAGGGNVYIYSGSPIASPNLSAVSPSLANAYSLPTYDPTQVAFGQAYGSTIAGGASSQILFRQSLASISPTPYPRPSPQPNPTPAPEPVSEFVATISPSPWPTTPSSPKPSGSPTPSFVTGEEAGTATNSIPLRPTMLASVLGTKSVVKLTGGKDEQFNLSSSEDCLSGMAVPEHCKREDVEAKEDIPQQIERDRRRQINEIVRQPSVLQRLSMLINIH